MIPRPHLTSRIVWSNRYLKNRATSDSVFYFAADEHRQHRLSRASHLHRGRRHPAKVKWKFAATKSSEKLSERPRRPVSFGSQRTLGGQGKWQNSKGLDSPKFKLFFFNIQLTLLLWLLKVQWLLKIKKNVFVLLGEFRPWSTRKNCAGSERRIVKTKWSRIFIHQILLLKLFV